MAHLYHHLKSEDACEDVVHVLQSLEPKGRLLVPGPFLGPQLSPRPLSTQPPARSQSTTIWGYTETGIPWGPGPSSHSPDSDPHP